MQPWGGRQINKFHYEVSLMALSSSSAVQRMAWLSIYRRWLGRADTRGSKNARPLLLFDHVPKAGGTAAGGALQALLPRGTVTPHLNPYTENFLPSSINSKQHIIGHFGQTYRYLVADFSIRLTATLLRDPVFLVVSTYTFWRYNVDRDFGPHVAAAHDLSFSDFIRRSDHDVFNLNPQSVFLGSPQKGNPRDVAAELLAPYRIVGTTDRMPEFLAAILSEIAPSRLDDIKATLARVKDNRSRGQTSVSDEDAAYINARQAYDRALYDLACQRAHN